MPILNSDDVLEPSSSVAWHVPAQVDSHRYSAGRRMSVLRKGDGEQPWAELREGLPQTHSDDLVRRPDLALGPDRLIMAMASTIGHR